MSVMLVSHAGNIFSYVGSISRMLVLFSGMLVLFSDFSYVDDFFAIFLYVRKWQETTSCKCTLVILLI